MGIFPKFPFSQYGMPLQANHFSYRSYLLLAAADNGQVSALCLLDLTAAFDTVDHDLLMLRLERQFGLRGVVLQWFSSYLSGRSFHVVFGGHMSAFVVILCSVAQVNQLIS